MKKLLILTLAILFSFANTFAVELSNNDKNLKLHIENTLDMKTQNLVQDVLKKYTKRLEKFSDAKKTEINNKIIEKVNIKIDDFLMKYPQDVALPESANNIYLTLEYLQLSLAELNFGENTKSPVGLANPASEFCIKRGGTLEIKEQVGYCKLEDGTVVEEWEYFLGEGNKYNKYKTVSELKKYYQKIEDAKTCEVDSDCVVVPNSSEKCNFGCHGLYINKNKIGEISEIVKEKFGECTFDCMNVEKEVKCIKNKCTTTSNLSKATKSETKPQVNKTYKNDEPFTNIEGEKVEKVTLKVVGNKVYMNGTIATDTPKLFKKVFAENPQVDTLEMLEVPGSLDDEANLEIAKWIAKKGLTFILGKNGDIASGGTDFFLAGKTRIVHKGAKVGVHSWSEGEDGKTAKDYPRDSKVHQPYIDYYQAIGWNEADSKKFYYFTIDSATAHGMHSMTEQEMIDYRITTEGKIR